MKKYLIKLSFVTAIVLASAASYADSDEQAVTRVLESITHAIETHDLASVDHLWVKDSSFAVVDNGVASYGSWTSFREHVLTPELAPMKNLAFNLLNVKPHVVGAVAWITYEYRIQAQIKDKPMTSDGAATMVLQRAKNGWVAVHVNISSKRPEEAHDAAPEHHH